MPTSSANLPRPAWIEIDIHNLRQNVAVIRRSMPLPVRWLAVVKDDAYGHGMVRVARECLLAGASFLGVTTLGEGVTLRDAGIDAPVVLLGDRDLDELPFCLEYRLRVSLGNLRQAQVLDQLAQRAALISPVHLKVNTGMNRYGVDWRDAARMASEIRALQGLRLEGVMSHFSMSDESDKSFAREQIGRFQSTLDEMVRIGLDPGIRHMCNTGGFLDLPQAHFDMVRLGVLPTGVYPSQVCRRLEELQPVMALKAHIVAVQNLQPGEVYGYGLRYRAPGQRRIGVIPLGYGDGYPRLKNCGHVLTCGKRASIVGGVAMDAVGIDLTDIPEAQLGDECVLMGVQGQTFVTARDLATWGQTVCYDILAGWRHRLPRIEVRQDQEPAA
jgi:alanine racemase